MQDCHRQAIRSAAPPAGGETGWAVTEVAKQESTGKGLQSGALGLWGNVTIGLGSTAPAYSLAATLGYVVLTVGERAPAMFLLAFLPMLLVAIAYRELNRAAPDCGTTFTWGTKAFGPWLGWMGGWGVAVSAIIVLANVAEIAGIYLLRFLGQDELAENTIVKVALGIVFIAGMTYVSYRGIVLSERIQAILVAFQFLVLIGMSVIALAKVFNGTAGEQAVQPELSWLSPFGLESGAVAEAVILCIFIYWGWDACLAVTEETKDSDKTPGRAALISTVILLLTYLLVAFAIGSFAGFGETGIGLGNEENADDVLTIVGEPVLGAVMTSILLAHRCRVRGLLDPDHDPADGPRRTGHGGLRSGSLPVRSGPSPLQDPGFRHHHHGRHRGRVLPGPVHHQRERAGRLDRFTGPGGGVLLRDHRLRVRRVLPQDVVPQRPQLLPARTASAARRARDGGRLRGGLDLLHRPREQLHHVRSHRRHLRHRYRHAGPRSAADDRLLRPAEAVLPRRDAERRHPDPGPRHGRAAARRRSCRPRQATVRHERPQVRERRHGHARSGLDDERADNAFPSAKEEEDRSCQACPARADRPIRASAAAAVRPARAARTRRAPVHRRAG